ncbi:MAG: AMP-binding protein, partial [Flavobacteriales bacterium]
MNTVSRLFDIPYHQLKNYPQPGMFFSKKEGNWVGISTKEFLERSMQLSIGLMEAGVEPGDRIAVASTNRLEWNILDIAVQQIGAVLVPLYPTISSRDYCFILNDCEAKYMFVGNQEIADKILAVKGELKALKGSFAFDDVSGVEPWDTFFHERTDEKEGEVQQRMSKVQDQELATIIYTSGTTGVPKGVI